MRSGFGLGVVGWWAFVVAALPLSGCGGRSSRDELPAGPPGGGPSSSGGVPSVGGVSGGTGTGGVSGGSEEPPVTVDPEVSEAWTWQACGVLRPEPADREALFDALGNVVVLGAKGVRVYSPDGKPSNLDPAVNADSLVIAPDGSVMTKRTTAAGIELTPVGESAPRLVLPVPPNGACDARLWFSADGAHVLGSGDDKTCAWRASDASLVSTAGKGEQVTMRDSRFLALEQRLLTTDLVERDLAGVELSRRSFGEGAVFLSPAGDRIVTLANRSLVDLSSGNVVPLEVKSDWMSTFPVFSSRGGMVLVGDGVFRTADGARVASVNPEGRLRLLGGPPIALAADGKSVVGLGFGRASLLDVEAKGVRAALGPPLAPSLERDYGGVTDLAISRDGKLLIYNISSQGAFGIQIAPKLEDSQMVWDTRVELSMSVDVSNDGSLVAVGGDGRAIYDGRDGHAVWLALPPPPTFPIDVDDYCLLDRLRFSPNATWLASSDYSRDLQVFKMGAGTPWQPFLELPGACDAAAFSRDERLMATSAAAVYRTGASPDAWSRVWSQPLSPIRRELGYQVNDVAFSPDDTQLLISRCGDRNRFCTATFLDAATGAILRQPAELTGPHPAFSPDGSWVVAADQLLHLPSGRVRSLGAGASPTNPALFTPDGDIIAGAPDGSITRYCRNEGQ